MAAAVVAERVGRDYGAVCAVSDLSFEVDPGDVVGVLGRNGAGKTTSIRVLTTIVAPTRGRFAVAGVPHTRPDEIRRRIGVLPEGGGYPPRQTGAEHLVYHARLHGASRASARAAAAALLEEFGLADRARTPLGAYSLGMRRRLGIARALVNDPARSEPLRRVEPGQPRAQPVRAARPLRADPALRRRAAGLGRRPDAAGEPAHRRGALRRPRARRRAQLGRDADLLVAPAVAAIALATVALLAAGRMRLRPGGARRGAGSPSRLPCCLRWRGREPPARRSR